MEKKMSTQLNNGQLADLYIARASQTGIPAEEATRFAELIRTCERQLHVAYKRHGDNLTGIREQHLDLTDDTNEQGKVLLEQILGGLARQPSLADQYSSKDAKPVFDASERSKIESGTSVDLEVFADARGGCRWNGQPYHSRRY